MLVGAAREPAAYGDGSGNGDASALEVAMNVDGGPCLLELLPLGVALFCGEYLIGEPSAGW